MKRHGNRLATWKSGGVFEKENEKENETWKEGEL